ncbi:hypothetical protein [Streptomyces sp. NBC_01614]|uniref:hypothetical protein n=1 Tax=Streptomyces sp. NBC_01614 TaxID=2975897 RepID=UPI00386F1299
MDAAGDLHGGRIGGATDPQSEFAEVVEDHAIGGADPALVRVEADHGLFGPQSASDLSLEELLSSRR